VLLKENAMENRLSPVGKKAVFCGAFSFLTRELVMAARDCFG